jgi:drug/metabolite transporter (DMT)-like permease
MSITKINRNGWAGPGWIILSAIGFGSVALFARIAYADGVGITSLLAWRFVLASLLLGPLVLARRLKLPRGRDLAGFMLLGVMYAAGAWSYFLALRYASSGLVALLVYTYPVLVAVLGAMLGMDRFGRAERRAVLTCSLGLILLLGHALTTGQPLGVALGLFSGFLYAVYILTGSRFGHDADPLAATWVVLTTAAVLHGAFAACSGPSWPVSTHGWLALLAMAVFSSAMAIAAFFAGLRHVGPTMASVLSTLEPVVTVGLGVGFLGESLSLPNLAGSILVLCAAAGLALARGKGQTPQPA